ncbi:hypothetical protein PW5551_04390 [Petrotoga sp. 9PW.55.5.1]|uniref:metal-sensitive transcriptional regulator n=1 Tax=Petrotoga sp. 9PW.55.5.1 TaxID=1308979 RepID=UPI000DC59777|nr:metal-sensitive transcriptional regulator [Petrotoga sp. 9PW.55.5.1]RAO99379.1 hypothetical protein PW5551_04390 [Petrotoga sp. 9PW.55.5.1]
MVNKNDKENLINRLKRIEGQVRGLQKMLEEERRCEDILTQLSAVKGALNKAAEEIMRGYTKSCIIEYEKSGNDKMLDELIEVLSKFREI